MMNIAEFQKEYRWLSNFWQCKVIAWGMEFPSVENAYQAAKESNPSDRAKYQKCSPAQAKTFGKNAKIRPDWNKARLSFMEELVRRKFFNNPVLKMRLIETGDAELIEGNCWHDTFWGVCNGKGENHLGKILMKIRSEIKNKG